jgi:hypothetical protein
MRARQLLEQHQQLLGEPQERAWLGLRSETPHPFFARPLWRYLTWPTSLHAVPSPGHPTGSGRVTMEPQWSEADVLLARMLQEKLEGAATHERGSSVLSHVAYPRLA